MTSPWLQCKKWLVLLLLTACVQPLSAAPAGQTCDAFAVRIFNELAKQQQGHIVFSPSSLEGVLHLLRQGARGTTAQELDTLPMGKRGIKSTLQPLQANALFIEEGFPLKNGIRVYAIHKEPLTKAPDKACQAINNWASQNTKGLIQKLITKQSLPAQTRLIAADVIYLKADWLHPFPKHATNENEEFTLADGSKTKVPMMHKTEQFRYAETTDWQAVAIDYKPQNSNGNKGYFIAVLPKGDARDFAQALTPQTYNKIRRHLSQTSKEKTHIGLPRFENDPGVMELTTILKRCGLAHCFSEQANFSGFTDEPLCLDRVLQRCYVKVDEVGTEAAAVTVGNMKSYKLPAKQPKKLILNRPFIWVIADINTAAAPYFMGLFDPVRKKKSSWFNLFD